MKLFKLLMITSVVLSTGALFSMQQQTKPYTVADMSLFTAIKSGNLPQVENVIATQFAGRLPAMVKPGPQFQGSPLELAFQEAPADQKFAIIQYLIAHGASPQDLLGALRSFINDGDLEGVKALLQAGIRDDGTGLEKAVLMEQGSRPREKAKYKAIIDVIRQQSLS